MRRSMSDKATSGDSWRETAATKSPRRSSSAASRPQRIERREPDVDVGVLQQPGEERRHDLPVPPVRRVRTARVTRTPRDAEVAVDRHFPAVGDALETLGDRTLLEQRERHHGVQIAHFAAQGGDIFAVASEEEKTETEADEQCRRERQQSAVEGAGAADRGIAQRLRPPWEGDRRDRSRSGPAATSVASRASSRARMRPVGTASPNSPSPRQSSAKVTASAAHTAQPSRCSSSSASSIGSRTP